MKCNFRNKEKARKILFKSKLSNEPIHFGHILVWDLKDFVQFCKDNKIITPHDRGEIFTQGYDVHYKFLYTTTIARTNFKPLAKITIWLSDKLGGILVNGLFCLRTNLQTIECGDERRDRYCIFNDRYIM